MQVETLVQSYRRADFIIIRITISALMVLASVRESIECAKLQRELSASNSHVIYFLRFVLSTSFSTSFLSPRPGVLAPPVEYRNVVRTLTRVLLSSGAPGSFRPLFTPATARDFILGRYINSAIRRFTFKALEQSGSEPHSRKYSGIFAFSGESRNRWANFASRTFFWDQSGSRARPANICNIRRDYKQYISMCRLEDEKMEGRTT